MSKPQDKIITTRPDFFWPKGDNTPAERLPHRLELEPGWDVKWIIDLPATNPTIIGYEIIKRTPHVNDLCPYCKDTGLRDINHPILGLVDRVWCEYCDCPAPKTIYAGQPTIAKEPMGENDALRARIKQLEGYLEKTADGKILIECDKIYCPQCKALVR